MKKIRYLRFEDPDELIGHLSLLDVSAIAVAVQTHEGEPLIIFNDTDQLEGLLQQVKEAADKLPVDAEVVAYDSAEGLKCCCGDHHKICPVHTGYSADNQESGTPSDTDHDVDDEREDDGDNAWFHASDMGDKS